MVAGTKVKWSPADLSRVGRAALALATGKKATLEARLPAGLLDGLAADLDAFDGKQSAATLATEALREATRTQDAAARAAVDFMGHLRAAVVRAQPPAAVRAAFGLSLRPNVNKVSSVVAALDAAVDGATRYPDVTREAGVLSSDVDRLKALRTALASADAKQESTKLTKKLPVVDRRQVQARIEKATDTIINAGAMAFADKPDEAQLFRSLVPSRGLKKVTPASA